MAEAMRRYYDERGFRRGTFLLMGLLMFQIALGVATFILKATPAGEAWPLDAKVALATSHVAIGALLLAVSLLLTLGSHRLFVPSREAPVGLSSSPIGGREREKPEEALA
jgi:heme A synthase